MSTARDLLMTAMDVPPSRPVESGVLSLALAGAELVDLLAAGTATLDDDGAIVPGPPADTADPLLKQAAASLRTDEPYEPVADWLWRRGRDLAPAYAQAFTDEGRIARKRRLLPSRTGAPALVDSPERQAAAARWASGEPVLATLAAAVGIRDKAAGDTPDPATRTVLIAVDDATVELVAARERRDIEQAAFDNLWRGF
ncbi:GOLPH3/VPS74 family protein [Yinghuangia soli]|uniref:GPP34 family phosphoprotein n=1 Tax=Yinghuangia soli TaxID=2908204 RepID=A0AA41Q7Z1_9ACTN|nr:GPP34 family phosphoprotein [Yinghuangia soli]MCF2532044.1 GPP34 family phosphoprotein [Yinghuangia soli]